MRDPEDDPPLEQTFECYECGAMISATKRPGSCQECGAEVRNRRYPLE